MKSLIQWRKPLYKPNYYIYQSKTSLKIQIIHKMEKYKPELSKCMLLFIFSNNPLSLLISNAILNRPLVITKL